MKKETVKGSFDDCIKKLIELRDNPENKGLKIKMEVSAVRSNDFNSYFQVLMRYLSSESGSIDFDNTPKEIANQQFEDFKSEMKDKLGYYIDYVTNTHRGKNIVREYISTADMTNKELIKFIELVENDIMESYPHMTRMMLKNLDKQFEISNKNSNLHTTW